MKQEKYVIKDKEYSRDALIEYGRNARPGVFWIPRMLGIIFMGASLFIMALIGITMLILNATGVFSEPDFPVWVFFIPLGMFGLLFLVGLIIFIVSFTANTDERNIKYAIKELSKDNRVKSSSGEPLLTKRDEDALKRYDRLLKAGAMSQEEYDEKVKEIKGQVERIKEGEKENISEMSTYNPDEKW